MKFYRRYHSSSFVDNQLVLRLNSPLSAETLSEINDTFADILASGQFEHRDHPLEVEEGAYPDKARLVFAFDRRSAGRLKLLIDRINEEP